MKAIMLCVLALISLTAASQKSKTITLGDRLQKVPNLKKWVLNSNSRIKIQVKNGTLESGSVCNGYFMSNPRMLFNITGKNQYEQNSYGIIFENAQTVPFENEFTYEITPLRFVNMLDFSPLDLKGKSLMEIGFDKIEFYPGETVFLDNCIVGLELLEVDITQQEANELKDNAKKSAELRTKKFEEQRKERAKKIKEIQSKTYELENVDTSQYQDFLYRHKRDIKKAIEASKQIPSYETLNNTNTKFFRVTDVYSESLNLINPNADGNVPGGLVVDLSHRVKDLITQHDVKLLSGNDTSCEFIKKANTGLPALLIDGTHVMTQTTISNIAVDFSKGITRVLVSDGKVVFKKYAPPADIQEIIAKQIINEQWIDRASVFPTAYFVKYEVCSVLGESFVKVDNAIYELNKEFGE